MFVAMVDIVLKDEKKDDFKSWITESNQVLSKFDGFISRRLLEGQDGSNRILVEFENMELFKKMHQALNMNNLQVN